ncbi:RNA polymerase sigma factor [Bacillus sp. RO3]|nr:RNA polymerase sigma factor [Bacillus sp. RO3]
MLFENVEQTISKLYRYCLSMSGSTWMAEDLVQGTMLNVYKLKKTEPEREITYSFLYTIAKNLFIDEKRKEKVVYSFDEEQIKGTQDFLDYDLLIDALLVHLPLKQAMLLTLKDVFHYQTKEIAVMLRTSNESIKTALHRSRKKLPVPKDPPDMKELPNHHIIGPFSKAIKEGNPEKIFFYYRLLDAKDFRVERVEGRSVFHVIDPDGNILEMYSG